MIAITAAFALGGCGSGAQAPGAQAPRAQDSASLDQSVDGDNSILNAADALTPPTAEEFADKAAQSDAFEIASATLARDKARSADVKNFAATMIADNTASTAKVKEAAAAALPEITPDPTLTADQRDKLKELRKLNGADFDKVYADQQIKADEDALSLMELYADKGDFAPLTAAAGQIAPTVQTQLDTIKAIRTRL